MFFRRKHNDRAIAAVVAIGRAHARMPGFEIARAKELAGRIDGTMRGVTTMHCVFALTVCLLATLGLADAGDESRFSPLM